MIAESNQQEWKTKETRESCRWGEVVGGGEVGEGGILNNNKLMICSTGEHTSTS